MSQIKYLINTNNITFYRDKQIKVVNDSKFWMFEALRRSLLETGTDQGYINYSVQDHLTQLVKERSDKFGIRERLNSLEQSDMPTEPFISCINRIPAHILEEHPEFIEKLGSQDIPLTWDGDIVMYQRSAWLNDTPWANDSSFQPFKEVTGNLQVSSFTDTMNRCPDTGMAYEVLVKPENLVKVQGQNSRYLSWSVKAITQLSKLGSRFSTDKQSETPIVEYNLNCVGDTANAIRLPFNAGTAAKLVNMMMSNQVELSSMNNIVPARVTQTVSC